MTQKLLRCVETCTHSFCYSKNFEIKRLEFFLLNYLSLADFNMKKTIYQLPP